MGGIPKTAMNLVPAGAYKNRESIVAYGFNQI
jgi:hypothetical protein